MGQNNGYPKLVYENAVSVSMGLSLRNKTYLQGFQQSQNQTSLLRRYTDWLDNLNFTCSKFKYDTFQKGNNNGTDQSVQVGRLVCNFRGSQTPKTGFLALRPICVTQIIQKSIVLFFHIF